MVTFFTIIVKMRILAHPTVDSRGVIMGRSVAVAVGCLLSLTLQQDFHNTSGAVLCIFNVKKNGIVASIRIGQKNQCLPYAGLLSANWGIHVFYGPSIMIFF